VFKEDGEWGLCASEACGAVWVYGGQFEGDGGVAEGLEVASIELDGWRNFAVAISTITIG